MIVGLGHQARVGKDAAAHMLVDHHGFRRLAFADALKDLAYRSDPEMPSALVDGRIGLRDIVDESGWERAKEHPEVRAYLQRLGVGAREVIGGDVWVRPVLDQIRRTPQATRWVITDVRFKNEFHALWRLGAKLIKLTRKDSGSNAGTHVSETELSNADWTHVIANDGTLAELERNIIRAIKL